MSFDHIHRAMCHSQAKGSARLVLLVLAAYCHPKSSDAIISRKVIMKRSRVSRRAVTYALRTLEKLGEIRTELCDQEASRYTVTVGPRQDPPA